MLTKPPHNNVASPVTKIKEVMASLPRVTVAKACRQFHRRIEAVVEAGGDFFE
jgi:hypothetical protein